MTNSLIEAATTTDLINRARGLSAKRTRAQLVAACRAAGHLSLDGWTKAELATEAARAELIAR